MNRSKDSFSGICKPCEKEYKIGFYKNNRERLLAEKHKHYLANRDDYLYRMKRQGYERTCGLTPEEVNEIDKKQNHRCAICGKKKQKGKNWHMDHNHETKQPRGLLCVNCNLGVGHFKDRPALLRAAAIYLEKHDLVKKENA